MIGFGGCVDVTRLIIACLLIGGALALVPTSSFADESGSASSATCTATPTEFCGDKELSRLKASVASAYQQAAERVQADPSISAELAREHDMFLQSRESAGAFPGASLAHYMQTWRQWLDTVAPARLGWEGIWISGSGSLRISPRADRTYSIDSQADDPIQGSYTCRFRGVGRSDSSVLEVVWDVSDDGEDGADGWTLRLRRDSGVLRLEQRRNASEAPSPPFCGVHGSLEGAYLPARVLPEPVTAWKALTSNL